MTWSARFLVLKNADGFEKYTKHVLCGNCQLTNYRQGRKSYERDPCWDERSSRKHAIDEKWSDGLDADFYSMLSEEEHALREHHHCKLEVSEWIIHEPDPPHSAQCQAIDGAPQASITGSGGAEQMDVEF